MEDIYMDVRRPTGKMEGAQYRKLDRDREMVLEKEPQQARGIRRDCGPRCCQSRPPRELAET